MKDPLINYPFALSITSPKSLEFTLDLFSRSFNLQNKETIYNDKKLSSILIEISPIYENLQSKNEVIFSHFLNETAFVTISYSLSQNRENSYYSQKNQEEFINSSRKKTDFQQNREEFEENEQLTNELIENFHKTINEINKDMNYQEKNPDFLQEFSNKKEENYEESPSKLEKTMVISLMSFKI